MDANATLPTHARWQGHARWPPVCPNFTKTQEVFTTAYLKTTNVLAKSWVAVNAQWSPSKTLVQLWSTAGGRPTSASLRPAVRHRPQRPNANRWLRTTLWKAVTLIQRVYAFPWLSRKWQIAQFSTETKATAINNCCSNKNTTMSIATTTQFRPSARIV